MKNNYEVKGSYTTIYVSCKEEVFECIIDTDDLEKVSEYSWYVNPKGYILCRREETTYIHRLITSCPKGKQVDHINRNKLDNRKENLRIVTNRQNCQNRALMPNNKTGYRGVYFENYTQKYRVQLVIDGKTMDFGRYEDIDVAGYVAGQIIKNFMPYAEGAV